MQSSEREALVESAAAAIRAEEGAYHCRGRYYARQYDATFWRAVEAERMVDAAQRHSTRLARQMAGDLERWNAAMNRKRA